ncbi:MAG: GNAT family N-acetyltransferase [Actinobacteria bacterium]|nr:GNAT family N-acetyltransferase [Actinomycetota bacterium]
MPTGVRPARTSDVDDIAAVQIRTWRVNYSSILPAAELAALEPGDLALTWASGILNPPTPSHRLMVALDGSSGSDVLVGYAAFGPNTDPDSDPATAELLALVIDPDCTRQGHGSRLLAATVDHLRASGSRTLITWLPLADELSRAFFIVSGWGPDSAFRDRVISEETVLREVRLVTDIEIAP